MTGFIGATPRRVTTCRVLIKFKLDYLQSNFKNYGIYQET